MCWKTVPSRLILYWQRLVLDIRSLQIYNSRRSMNRRLAISAVLALLVLVVGLHVGADIRSPANADFVVKVIGTEGTEFEGFCTHEVQYLIGSRTEATDLQGRMTADDNAFQFAVPGIEIGCVIKNSTPGNPITVILLKGNTEVNRVEGAGYHFYLDCYPPSG